MPDSNRKPHADEHNAAQLEAMLELELMQKRAAWQQARAGRGRLRVLAYSFLFLVVAAAFVALFLYHP